MSREVEVTGSNIGSRGVFSFYPVHVLPTLTLIPTVGSYKLR